jgi:hypothetical protein
MFGSWILLLKYILIMLGSSLMVYAWKSLPNLSELDWMRKMEKLYIIHKDTSTLLFQYQFRTEKSDDLEDVDSDLAGSAIGGIDMLLSEILANSGHIKEIEHGDKKINFVHGDFAISILIGNGSSNEFKYRLEVFHLTLEKLYSSELANFNGALAPFTDLESLVRKYFL